MYRRMELKLCIFLTRAVAGGKIICPRYLKSPNAQQNRVHSLPDDISLASFQNIVV
jgi:hypothetical protein